MADGMSEFRDLYVQTAQERLKQLNEFLLQLEANPSELKIIEELMRTGHSLKGESAAMGFEQIAVLGHVIEDLFTAIGAGKITISKPIMDALFAGLDYIEQSVNQIASDPEAMDLDSSAHVKKLKELTGLATEGAGKSAQQVEVASVSDKSIEKTATVTSTAPSSHKEDISKSEGKTEIPVSELVKEVKVVTPPLSEIDISPVVMETETSEKKIDPVAIGIEGSPANMAKKTSQKSVSTVTLKVEKLDTMMSISEELVLLKMKLKNSAIVEENAQLKAEIHRLDRLVTDLQFNIMQARLFPISLAMQTLPRLVRDVSGKTGKNVQLIMEGQDTTVDRTIIDHLNEPFVHMIRNAIDHGVEFEKDRVAAGKSPQATLQVVAYTKENKVYVEIRDDGQGIEWESLARVAVKKGAIDENTANTYLNGDKKRLLFLDGVSTSETVTDVSGRGVGMSAVERAIKKLGGEILVDTVKGKGTTFTLRLPLTLAIMQALLIMSGNQTYALPTQDVVRSIQITEEDVQSSGNTPVIIVDDMNVPLIDLKGIFSIEDTGNPNEQMTRTVVLLRKGTDMWGCMVDKIIAEEEILVKPLDPLLKRHSTIFSGATILPNGNAAAIINIEGLIQS